MDNLVHALSHEMQSKSTRTKFARGQALERFRPGFRSPINVGDLQSRFGDVRSVKFVKLNLNGAFKFAAVRVTNHAGDGFVQSQGDFVAVLVPEADRASQRGNNSPDAA